MTVVAITMAVIEDYQRGHKWMLWGERPEDERR